MHLDIVVSTVFYTSFMTSYEIVQIRCPIIFISNAIECTFILRYCRVRKRRVVEVMPRNGEWAEAAIILDLQLDYNKSEL